MNMINVELPDMDPRPELAAGVVCSLPNCRRSNSPVSACKCACHGRNHGTADHHLPPLGMGGPE